MNTCCCGHGRGEHTDTVMSVPMVNPTPIYKLPPFGLRAHPTATYNQQLCHCGCSQYEPDA